MRSETTEEKEEQCQIRVDEIEDQQEEEEVKQQDLVQEREDPVPDRGKTPLPESGHIPDEQKIEEQRMEHCIGIEEKL